MGRSRGFNVFHLSGNKVLEIHVNKAGQMIMTIMLLLIMMILMLLCLMMAMMLLGLLVLLMVMMLLLAMIFLNMVDVVIIVMMGGMPCPVIFPSVSFQTLYIEFFPAFCIAAAQFNYWRPDLKRKLIFVIISVVIRMN